MNKKTTLSYMSNGFNWKKVNFSYYVIVGTLTFFYLVKNGIGVLFSLLLLIPCTFVSLLFLGVVIELIIEPIYRWLRK